jgi:hypothetical protein
MSKRRLFATAFLIGFQLSVWTGVQISSPFFHIYAQSRNTTSGHIFDSQRNPLTEIYVEFQNDFYSTLARVLTDVSGRYFVGNNK